MKVSKTFSLEHSVLVKLEEYARTRGLRLSEALECILREYLSKATA